MTILNNIWRLKDTRKKLRNNCTKSEELFWNELKWKKILWLKFRRQHSVWRYILDFYCPKLKIWIELDWNHHLQNEFLEYDKIRTEYLESDKITIFRFLNSEIENNIEWVLNKLRQNIQNKFL